MTWHDRIRTALAGAGHEPDHDILEELSQYAKAMYDAARADGTPVEEAERRVGLQIALWSSDASLMKKRPAAPVVVVPPPASSARLSGLWQDTRYAARLLRKRPGATVVSMITMALGIGATTVLFSVAWGVLFKPLPWPDADRLVRLSETRQGSTRRLPPLMTNGTYLSWQESPSTIDALAAWTPSTYTLTGAGEPQRMKIAGVTPSAFSMLRASPLLGRVFTGTTGEDATAVVLSHGLWRQIFGGADDVLGRAVQLDGTPRTIVGVMPAGFSFPDRDTRAWVPYEIRPLIGSDPNVRSMSLFSAMARLKPGVTPGQAAQEATARGRSGPDPGMVAIAVFGSNGPVDVAVVPVLEHMTRDIRDAVLIFMVAVGLLLATATANVASVQLARATTRRREMAVRAALGAGSRRLARQLLVENVLLGLLGGLLGLAAAFWLHRALPSILPPDFPRVDDVHLDLRVAAFAIVVSVAASVLFGLLPALHARRINVVESLTEDGLAPIGAGARTRTARARALIMAGQVAVASVLLVGASLLIRSFTALMRADLGYDAANVLTTRVPMPDSTFTPARRAQILDNVLDRLHATPGVTAAGMTSILPLGISEALMAFRLPPSGGATEPVAVQSAVRTVSPEYFAALGMRRVEGRLLTAADTRTSLPVVVVNRSFVQRYLNGQALGRKLPTAMEEGKPEWEIAGVVDDVRMRSATDPPQPEIFVSYRQLNVGVRMSEPILVVRSEDDPTAMVSTIRALVREQDSRIALDAIGTMEQRLLGNLARPRLYAILLGGFAGFALLIAAVGLFGVLSYSVAQRSREIAVRSALGARPADNMRLVLRQGIAVTGVGLVAGLAASAALTRAMAGFLYGVTRWDAVTYVVVPLVLLGVATVACLVPAWRAARLDPLKVLKGA